MKPEHFNKSLEDLMDSKSTFVKNSHKKDDYWAGDYMAVARATRPNGQEVISFSWNNTLAKKFTEKQKDILRRKFSEFEVQF